MDEIEKRLRMTADQCIDAYGNWTKDKLKGALREKLQEAVHELRKVASRLEIEIAASEREEMSSKPIPIPTHRASRRKTGQENFNDGGQNQDDETADGDFSQGQDSDGGQSRAPVTRTVRRRVPRRGPSSSKGDDEGNQE